MSDLGERVQHLELAPHVRVRAEDEVAHLPAGAGGSRARAREPWRQREPARPCARACISWCDRADGVVRPSQHSDAVAGRCAATSARRGGKGGG